MLEKELKILDVDIEELKEKLESFGGEKTFEGYIHDVYYDYPEDKLDGEKRLFRVRKKGETHLYTIKRKRKELKKEMWLNVKDEHETEITDLESFTRVLEKYGMKKTREKKKLRISYRIGEIEFYIDDYEIFPPLLEIEAHTTEQINDWIEKLGLTQHETLLCGSRSLFKHYEKPYLYHEED